MRTSIMAVILIAVSAGSATGGYYARDQLRAASITPLKGDRLELTRGYGHPLQGNVVIKLAPDTFYGFSQRDVDGFTFIDKALHEQGFVRSPVGPDPYLEPVDISTDKARGHEQEVATNVVSFGGYLVTIDPKSAYRRHAVVRNILEQSRTINTKTKDVATR